MRPDSLPAHRRRRWTAVAACAAVALPVVVAAVSTPAAAAPTLTPVEEFGPNPSDLNMYVYVPDSVADGTVSDPALLVGIHWCSGSAQAYYDGTVEWRQAADEQGFVIVYPENERSDRCFDVASPESLTRGGASDTTGIRSMVEHAVGAYDVDTDRIVVTGISSGAMMTQLLAAQYPDVFAAGAAFAGVPATCFATGSSQYLWSTECSQGLKDYTGEEWADAVRVMNPGYDGPYPRMQLWHGTTDDVLAYANHGEAIQQWTTLHGLDAGAGVVDAPEAGWVRTRYGTADAPTLEGIELTGVGHNLVAWGMAPYALEFLGLDEGGPEPTPSPTGEPTEEPTPSPTDEPTEEPGGCTAELVVTSTWPGGFSAQVTVTAGEATSSWSTVLDLPDATSVVNLWSGVASGEDPVTVTNAGWNGSLAAGATTSYGFIGSGPAPGSPAGLPCA
jgi:acetylxylan esterase